MLRIRSVFLESDNDGTLIFAPVIVHVTQIIGNEHLNVLLALEGTRHVTPHFQQFLSDIGTCQLAGGINVTLSAGDVSDCLAFGDDGTDTVERVLNIRLFFIRTVFAVKMANSRSLDASSCP